ncbi:lasso peptide biosynthesis B2 protein [Brevundimonas sp. BAL450]|uniref:lasso peptide biosynthesis B2 protein n=1 Tax=Brevundimonas sp. BAL450 TaxID=1708162 RepID=UPI0018CA9B57|nr:lasso peptide biosynthesis B2 protein [Brevundimonas sp. BAL450]MBG7614681.1 lasso peptide biosynthesis B2 protein [Brevundimonas sp. BAL450]
MTFHLREDIHVALIDEDAVILHVTRDAYLCVPGGAAGFEGTATSPRLRPGPLAQRLEAAGMTRETPAPPRRLAPASPTRSIIHEAAAGRPSAPELRHAAGALNDLRRVRRRPGLAPYLELVREDSALSCDPDQILPAARQFWDIMVWLPFRGECLQRSALLVAWLQRHGLRAEWVFGVRLWPFSAHCWVQCEDVCLNDDFERLQAFTPILRR